jgi:two-component system cell cycle response regulator
MNASGDLQVLVVDDSPVVVEVVRAHLEHAGFAVADAGDVDAAVAAADKARPDLVLLDVNLPSGSGLDVLRAFRGNAALASMLVIMVTREADPARVVEALELGADDFMRKPFEPAELLARVHAALRRRRSPGGRPAVDGAGPVDRAGLRAAVAAAGSHATSTLIAIRIDQLRDVNRQAGEHAGDQLVASVAAQLAEAVGPGTAVGRLSGATLAAVTTSDPAVIAASLRSTARVDGVQAPLRAAWTGIDPAQPESALSIVEDLLDA